MEDYNDMNFGHLFPNVWSADDQRWSKNFFPLEKNSTSN